MYICVCNGVTEKQIIKELENSIQDGELSLKLIRKKFGLGSSCGKCLDSARQLIHTYQVDVLPAEKIEIKKTKN